MPPEREKKKISPTEVCSIAKYSSVEIYPNKKRLGTSDFFHNFPFMSVLKADK